MKPRNAKGYQATHNLLKTLVENDNHIVYTDEAWWRKKDQLDDAQQAADILKNINHLISNLRVAPEQIGNRYEQIGIHDPAHVSGQIDSRSISGEIHEGGARAGADRGGFGHDYGHANKRMAEGTGSESGSPAEPLTPENTGKDANLADKLKLALDDTMPYQIKQAHLLDPTATINVDGETRLVPEVLAEQDIAIKEAQELKAGIIDTAFRLKAIHLL